MSGQPHGGQVGGSKSNRSLEVRAHFLLTAGAALFFTAPAFFVDFVRAMSDVDSRAISCRGKWLIRPAAISVPSKFVRASDLNARCNSGESTRPRGSFISSEAILAGSVSPNSFPGSGLDKELITITALWSKSIASACEMPPISDANDKSTRALIPSFSPVERKARASLTIEREFARSSFLNAAFATCRKSKCA